MIKQTTWHPDTCDCVLIYEWDTEHPSETRVHTPVMATPCAYHAEHLAVGISHHHQTITAENQRKNHAVAALHAAIHQTVPDVLPITDPHGRRVALRLSAGGVQALQETHPEAKVAHVSHADIGWHYGAGRQLMLTSPVALNPSHVAHIDADAIHGPGGRLK